MSINVDFIIPKNAAAIRISGIEIGGGYFGTVTTVSDFVLSGGLSNYTCTAHTAILASLFAVLNFVPETTVYGNDAPLV